MNLFQSPKKLFKATVPDMKNYVGKTVTIDGKKVVIKTICGNRFKQTFYEINGEHLIGMLRFHAQMTGAKDITEDQFKQFEEMDVEAEKLPTKPDPLRMKKNG